MNHLAGCILTPAGLTAWQPLLHVLPFVATVAAAAFALGLAFREGPSSP